MTEGIDFENVQVIKIPSHNLEIEMKGMEVVNVRDTIHPQKPLTPREEEILGMVRQKMTSKEIAEKLVISRRTVEIHRSHILDKLGLQSPRKQLLYLT